MELGELKEMDIRKVWAHEQYDFSKWLSEENNINKLGDTLGLTLSDIETEKFVGNYRCDIICKDEVDRNVIIENQLEPSNHDHLGKIITYASGLDASIVIWIVSEAREEHASAIEWLNNHTDKNLSFFLIEIHAYTIDGSKPAPYFKIIEQPNDFAKQLKSMTGNDVLNESQNKRLEFWTKFNERIEANKNPFNKRKPTTDHWYSVAIGSSKCHISIDLVNREHKIRVSLWIPNDKSMYDKFHDHCIQIEEAIGLELNWDRMDNNKASYIYTYIEGLDFNHQENYEELMDKVIEYVVVFKKAFSPYIN